MLHWIQFFHWPLTEPESCPIQLLNGNSKIMMMFVYWRLNNCNETVNGSPLLRMARMETDCIFNFPKFLYPSLRQNQKYNMDYSSCKKPFDILAINFKAIFSALMKVKKKDFCIVLAGLQQKCHDRAPLRLRTLFNTAWLGFCLLFVGGRHFVTIT